MRRIKNKKNYNIEFAFQKHFKAERDIGERDFYYMYDKKTNEKIGEMLVKTNENSIYIGDIDMYDSKKDKEFYNKGYGRKIINILKEQFNNINGQTIYTSEKFWLKCGATFYEKEGIKYFNIQS